MDPVLVVVLMMMFLLKHFIVDFCMQVPYYYLNKGTYGHPGGIFHAMEHAIGTFLVLMLFLPLATISPILFILLPFFDFVTHYHIDWGKVFICKRNQYDFKTEAYWIFLGLDQLLHGLVYCIIVFFVVV